MIIASIDKSIKKLEYSSPASGNRMVQVLWRAAWQLFRFDMALPDDPALPLLDIYPRLTKTYVYTKTCTEVFLAAFS
jgi:hypothetical protein